jgi:hypothetical protein
MVAGNGSGAFRTPDTAISTPMAPYASRTDTHGRYTSARSRRAYVFSTVATIARACDRITCSLELRKTTPGTCSTRAERETSASVRASSTAIPSSHLSRFCEYAQSLPLEGNTARWRLRWALPSRLSAKSFTGRSGLTFSEIAAKRLAQGALDLFGDASA